MKISIWLALLIGVVVLMSFASKNQEKKACWNIEVKITGNESFKFVSEQMILDKINGFNGVVTGRPISDLNLSALREEVATLHAVDKVELVTTLDGQLLVELSQREPIMRVLFEDGSGIYIDKEGFAMPLASHYTAHVPVLTGKLGTNATAILTNDPYLQETKNLSEAYTLVGSIQNYDWLADQVEHLAISPEGDFVIIPRVGNHDIVVGDTRNLDRKFKKLLAFYNETIGSRDLNKYTSINLKYRDQVVCSKRPW